jgi:Holliday junction resolvase RusA-like endonuclease
MNFTHDILRQMGYKVDANGNYSRTETNPARVSNSKPECHAKQALESLPQVKERSKNRTRIRIERYSCRPLDCDNYAGGCKPIIDELRYSKLIQDDDPETIEVEFKQIKVSKKTEERTEISIKEL